MADDKSKNEIYRSPNLDGSSYDSSRKALFRNKIGLNMLEDAAKEYKVDLQYDYGDSKSKTPLRVGIPYIKPDGTTTNKVHYFKVLKDRTVVYDESFRKNINRGFTSDLDRREAEIYVIDASNPQFKDVSIVFQLANKLTGVSYRTGGRSEEEREGNYILNRKQAFARARRIIQNAGSIDASSLGEFESRVLRSLGLSPSDFTPSRRAVARNAYEEAIIKAIKEKKVLKILYASKNSDKNNVNSERFVEPVALGDMPRNIVPPKEAKSTDKVQREYVPAFRAYQRKGPTREAWKFFLIERLVHVEVTSEDFMYPRPLYNFTGDAHLVSIRAIAKFSTTSTMGSSGDSDIPEVASLDIDVPTVEESVKETKDAAKEEPKFKHNIHSYKGIKERLEAGYSFGNEAAGWFTFGHYTERIICYENHGNDLEPIEFRYYPTLRGYIIRIKQLMNWGV